MWLSVVLCSRGWLAVLCLLLPLMTSTSGHTSQHLDKVKISANKNHTAAWTIAMLQAHTSAHTEHLPRLDYTSNQDSNRSGGKDVAVKADTSTQSLEQNIEDYYNSVDIEFENLSENDGIINVDDLQFLLAEGSTPSNTSSPTESPTVLDNPLSVQHTVESSQVRFKRNFKSKELSEDDIEEEMYEELVESFDEEEEEDTSDPTVRLEDGDTQREKYYRDTFMDRIIEDMKVKRPKLLIKKQKRDVKLSHPRDRELTGDTVLHLQSEISDVIKSETDLKGTLLPPSEHRPVQNSPSDSYVDNFMIHPSEFIQDSTPFQKEAANLGTWNLEGGKSIRSENNKRYRKDATDTREAFEDNTTIHNNTSNIILAMLDSRKVLKCHLPTTESRTIVWVKDGERIPSHGAASSGYEMTPRGDIVIKRIGREHQGKWRCEEQKAAQDNSLHSADKDRDLIVMESPSAPYLEVFGRRLDPGNVFLPAREGTELVMACHVERGTPAPSLRWETSKPMHMLHQFKQGVQFTSAVATLVVRRSHHNTTISCLCEHPSLPAPTLASTLLHVQYAPRFGISRTPGFGFPLEEGSAVSLKCDVDSNPPATPTWRKDEREPPVEQTDDGYLNFTSVRREHSGWYKCSATHPLGNFSSIGYFLNVRYEVESATEQQIYHQTLSRNEENLAGGVVQLQCPPGSVGCWSKNTPAPPPPSSIPVGLIRQDKQSGSYACSGLSQSEASRLHAMLGEQKAFTGGTPIVYPSNASLSVRAGHSVVLEGEFCMESGEPPVRVVWLAQGRALKLPDHYNRITTHHSKPSNSTSTMECSVATLSVSKSTASDSGEYSLVVRGKRGVGEAIFYVQVLEGVQEAVLEQAYSGAACLSLLSLSILLVYSMLLIRHCCY